MSMAERIQALRRAKGFSQEMLADELRVSRQAVSKWESDQSTPDVDKILAMSELFEVTTDYLLKGTAMEKQPSVRILDTRIFAMVGTALNFIGLVAACSIWYEKQVTSAVAIGAACMTLGCLTYGIGSMAGTPLGRSQARRWFWAVNVWFISLIPVSSLYTSFIHRHIVMVPYPMLYNSLKTYLLFWGGYVMLCAGVGIFWVRLAKIKES